MVKLSFGDVLSESFGFFFRNLPLFFHLVTVPWIISIGIRLAGATLVDDSLPAVLIEKLADVVPAVMFMVGWQRAVLLGPQRVGPVPGLAWSARESTYLVHLAKVAGVTFALVAGFILTIGSLDPEQLAHAAPVDPEIARAQTLAAPLSVGIILSTLLALRVSFGLAATAVDLPFSPRLSWTYSRGNGLTIVAALFLTWFVGTLVTAMTMLLVFGILRALGAQAGAAVAAWTFAILASYASAGVVATVQAVIFRRLLGWRDGGKLPAPPS